MDLGLNGRVAIIGGASKGLGKACALSLAQEGASVAICSRSAADLGAAAEEIRSLTGAEVLEAPGDLSRLEDIQNLINRTVDHFGRLDVVVCNSGGPPEGRALTTTDETWDRSIQMALNFFIRMGRESAPHLKKQGWGRIVNILASTVYQPIDNLVTSGVTRMGAVAFAKSLADEVGRDNILVNNVAPGFLLTDRMVGLFDTPRQGYGSVDGDPAPSPLLHHSPWPVWEAGGVGRPSDVPLLGEEQLRHGRHHTGGRRRSAIGAVIPPEQPTGGFGRWNAVENCIRAFRISSSNKKVRPRGSATGPPLPRMMRVGGPGQDQSEGSGRLDV